MVEIDSMNVIQKAGGLVMIIASTQSGGKVAIDD
jgi:hypothetical protein